MDAEEKKRIKKRYLFPLLFIAISTGSALGLIYTVKYSGIFSSKEPIEKDTPKINTRQLKSRSGAYLQLKNIFFRLTDNINLSVDSLTGEAVPNKRGAAVNFDDVSSFSIQIKTGKASVPVSVLEYIFNEQVFNFDGSPLKNLKMKFFKTENEKNRMLLTGEMSFGFWIPFEMEGEMILDKKNVMIQIQAQKITSLGNPLTKDMIGLVGLDLEKLLPLPPNLGIAMKGNSIIIEPYSLFPPPKINGYISDLRLTEDQLLLEFDSNEKLDFPPVPANIKNYLMVHQGMVQFGRLRMFDARLVMVDADMSDPFDFYLAKYSIPLTKGISKIDQNGKVTAFLPDFNEVNK